MNLVQITPGAGGMYCGNCFRDNALVSALRRAGHDTVMVPLYLPMTLDEPDAAAGSPTFFGGINVYLDQKSALHRHAPAWFRRLFDATPLLRWAAGKTASTRPSDVGELTVSMLQGERGHQSRDLSELTDWLEKLPHPDAVLLSNALLAGFTHELKQKLKTPVICFLQSEEAFLDSMPEPWRTRGWAELTARSKGMDGWIAPSRFFADRMTARLGLPTGAVQVVHNGIHLEGYDALPERPDPSPGQLLTLGFFARLCPEKGLDTVVDAFIALRKSGRNPALRLKIGGGCGPGDEPFVERQLKRLDAAGLASQVSIHRNVSRAEKVAFYASCDVVSVPARTEEAFGLYVIESLAAGTPLVQPSAGAYPELLAATGGGTICGANTAEALADTLDPLLRDPRRLRELGRAGRSVVVREFTDETMARKTVAALHLILDRPSAHRMGPRAGPIASSTSMVQTQS